ncbi:MAG: hypothetical protein ACRDWV_08820, partial [Acidimicrobiales bacterium]
EDAVSHLRAVSLGGLGGLVLSGCVERFPPAQLRTLAALARERLASKARLILFSTTPEAWDEIPATPAIDLAGGRPLHSQTWAHLLGSAGFEVTRFETDCRSFAISALRR